jgi:hypothetical protein
MRIVVLGGSGNFGARIARALRSDAGSDVLIARRRADSRGAAAASVALDLAAPDFEDRLKGLSPGLVINCVGPFQAQSYRAAKASLAAGAHYLDLADGREFVANFSGELAAAAARAGRTAITGASTLPALSSAVVQELRSDLTELSSIEVVIAPGQRAPRGRATLEGVFGYLGRAFLVWRQRTWQPAWGWMDLRGIRLDVGRRLAAACDVPDLALFPGYFHGVQTVRFHAALEFAIQHIALFCLAALRRSGAPFPVTSWAIALNHIAGIFDPLARDRGGMCVDVVGRRADGSQVRRRWQLAVPAVNGPEIPCMPAILLARRLARGEELGIGAYPCMGLLRLADFEPEFRKWDIVTRIQETLP